MTIGGLAGMAVITPLGACVDHTSQAIRDCRNCGRHQHRILATLYVPGFVMVAASQAVIGMAAAAVKPAIAAMAGACGQFPQRQTFRYKSSTI